MSREWEQRLAAVASLAVPPTPVDGEVRCADCGNEKLNRSDMTCWRCGEDRFVPASDEMRAALRFNYTPPTPPPPKQVAEMPGPGVGIPLNSATVAAMRRLSAWEEYVLGNDPDYRDGISAEIRTRWRRFKRAWRG